FYSRTLTPESRQSMTSEELLLEIEQRQWLSTSLMERLHAKVADSPRSLDAKTLAKFLVEKGHLTSEQAKELLENNTTPQADTPPQVEKAPAKAKPPEKSREPI